MWKTNERDALEGPRVDITLILEIALVQLISPVHKLPEHFKTSNEASHVKSLDKPGNKHTGFGLGGPCWENFLQTRLAHTQRGPGPLFRYPRPEDLFFGNSPCCSGDKKFHMSEYHEKSPRTYPYVFGDLPSRKFSFLDQNVPYLGGGKLKGLNFFTYHRQVCNPGLPLHTPIVEPRKKNNTQLTMIFFIRSFPVP